jgi:hypothetical protein
MGYTTHVTGEFAITPPLTYKEFQHSRFAPHQQTSRYNPSLVLRVTEKSLENDEGVFIKKTATDLVMRQIDEYREQGLVEEVQSAVDEFPGHTFTGYLDCEGDENTDIWRVYVKDGKAIRVEPEIVWPVL